MIWGPVLCIGYAFDLGTSLLKMKFLSFGVLGFHRGVSQEAIPEDWVSLVGYGVGGAGGSVP